MEAVCYNKRIPIFTCEIEKNQIIKLKEILDKDHFPIILQKNYTVQSMNKWLQSRMISEKRDGLKAGYFLLHGQSKKKISVKIRILRRMAC